MVVDKVGLVGNVAGKITAKERLCTESLCQLLASFDESVDLLLESKYEVGDAKDSMMFIDPLLWGKGLYTDFEILGRLDLFHSGNQQLKCKGVDSCKNGQYLYIGIFLLHQ